MACAAVMWVLFGDCVYRLVLGQEFAFSTTMGSSIQSGIQRMPDAY
jgi:hypothetical protein